MLGGAAPAGADDAGGVAVVDVDERVVAFGEIADLVELRDDAVHGEDAVGGDELEARAGRIGGFELRFEVGHVVVLVAVALRLAEAHAVDDGRVVQLIGDDGVFGAQQCFEEAAIGVEA